MSDAPLYPKIETLYKFESDKPHRMMLGQWNSPLVEMLKDVTWTFTEKVDGTNIRVIWDGYKVSYGGRTENAQIPIKLLNALRETFEAEGFDRVLEQQFGNSPVVLYGEGYGPGIQKGGGNYRSTPAFILFDVRVGSWWLERHNVEDVGRKLGVEVVPIYTRAPLMVAIQQVRQGVLSIVSENHEHLAEGYVGRPKVEVYDRKGNRVTIKIKTRDFQPGRYVEPS